MESSLRDKAPVEMEAPPTDYFRYGKAMLRVWGLWPIKGLSRNMELAYKAYGIFIISVTLVPYNVFSTVDAVEQMLQGRWLEIMPRFSVTLAMLLGCVKVAVCAYHVDTIDSLMKAYEQPIFTYKSTEYFRPNLIIKKCIWMYNIQLAVCIGLIGILIMTDIDSLLKESVVLKKNISIHELPFVNWLPYDYSYTPVYELSFCLTNFWFFVSADVIYVFDTICMGMLIHTAGQLKILRKALQTLHMRAVQEAQQDTRGGMTLQCRIDKNVKQMFRKCAVHHQAIIKYTGDFKQVYSTIIFLQFFISCLMICFTILVVTSIDSPISSRITSLIIFLCSMWELSVYCYFGNEVVHESNKISMAVYMSGWCLMEESMKSSMCIMIERAHRSLVITVGRFVPLSLETFIKILKASYSYYAFLRNVSDN